MEIFSIISLVIYGYSAINFFLLFGCIFLHKKIYESIKKIITNIITRALKILCCCPIYESYMDYKYEYILEKPSKRYDISNEEVFTKIPVSKKRKTGSYYYNKYIKENYDSETKICIILISLINIMFYITIISFLIWINYTYLINPPIHINDLENKIIVIANIIFVIIKFVNIALSVTFIYNIKKYNARMSEYPVFPWAETYYYFP